MSSAPDLPPSLKPLKPYLTHAQQLDKHDPVMAYYCRYYAVQLGIDLKAKHPAEGEEIKKVLIVLLDRLEKDKQALGGKLEQEDYKQAYVEAFALRVFSQADSEDRSGNASKTTARSFYAASIFLNVLKQFEPNNTLPLELEEKLKYAKWKAADITMALREGRTPIPGPHGNMSAVDDEEGGSATTGVGAGAGGSSTAPSSQQSFGGSAALGGTQQGAGGFGPTGYGGSTADPYSLSSLSGFGASQQTAPASSGGFGPSSAAGAGASWGMPAGSPNPYSYGTGNSGGFSGNAQSNYGMGSSAPSDPSGRGVDSFGLPSVPSSNRGMDSFGNAPTSAAPPSYDQSAFGRPQQPTTPVSLPVQIRPVQTPTPTAQRQVGGMSQSSGQQKPNPMLAVTRATTYDDMGLSIEVIDDAQRHAKHALIALQYNDVQEAVRELQIALQTLTNNR